MKQKLDLHQWEAEIRSRTKCCLQYGMEKVKTLDFWEFALLKICLISFGVWLGTAFSRTMKKFRLLFLLTFLGTCIYLIWRMFWSTEE